MWSDFGPSTLRWACAACLAACALAGAAKLDGTSFIATAYAAQKDSLRPDLARFMALYQARNYEAASQLAPSLIEEYRASIGENDPNFISLLSTVVRCYEFTGRSLETEPLLKLAIAVVERNAGPDNVNLALILQSLANLYRKYGRYEEAEPLFRRQVAIAEKTDPATGVLGRALNEIGVFFIETDRYAEAEAAYRRALTIEEKRLGPDTRGIGSNLRNLATLYLRLGRYEEADALLTRAFANAEQPGAANKSGSSAIATQNHNVDLAKGLTLRGDLDVAMGRYADAESDYRRGIAFAATIPESSPGLATAVLNKNLAELYLKQARYAEAEPLLQQELAVIEKAFGPNNHWTVEILDGLGTAEHHLGRDAEAEASYIRALAIGRQALGDKHVDVGNVLSDLAAFRLATGRLPDALEFARKGVDVASGLIIQSVNGVGLPTQLLQSHFEVALEVLRRASSERLVGADVAAEAFQTAQWMNQSTAAAALNQMAARFGAGSGALATLVREQQDAAAKYHALDKSLVTEEAAGTKDGNAASEQQQRARLSELDQSLKQLNERLAAEFPDYAALTSSQPLAAVDVQKLLADDEALVFLLAGAKATQVFAVTRAALTWQTVSVGVEALTKKVAAFRRGLDVDEYETSVANGKPILFDLSLSHDLYATLLQPVEGAIKDKKRLIVVPTGPLTALPFHLLVTQAPAGAANPSSMQVYRDAAWLLKRHAISVLPSVASLKALRVLARKQEASKPLVGFGDPIFNADAEAKAAERGVKTAATRTRALSDYWQGVGVEPSKLAQALPRLADTADELRAVAQKLGAPASDIHLRADASETTVKHLPLADYRVVYFATHGLVAGDVKGLAEPSLALTLPKTPSPVDDGLLTASEVAELKLDADWVVLSACNTVAGDKPGAEAMSGLARAFFYAGARALLVSHWSVASRAATRLTTSTFEILQTDRSIGRAEALRRAMLNYLADGSAAGNAYPAFWAPFEVIGEGSAR